MEEPEEVTLYYDLHVTSAVYSCPILLTDHYFAKHDRPPSTSQHQRHSVNGGGLVFSNTTQSQLSCSTSTKPKFCVDTAGKSQFTISGMKSQLCVNTAGKSQFSVSGIKSQLTV